MLRSARYKLKERVAARSALYDLQAAPNEFDHRIDDTALADVRGVMVRAEQYPALDRSRVIVARPATATDPTTGTANQTPSA